jgi:hypothetical protein
MIFNTQKGQRRSAFHKAGFTCRKKIKLVGATIGRPRAFNERLYKQNSAEKTTSLPNFVITVGEAISLPLV